MSQQINLYNPALAPKVQLLSGHRLAVGLAAAGAGCLLLWVAVGVDAARLARAERAQAARLAQAQAEIVALAQQVAARKPSVQLQADLHELGTLTAARQEVMAVLAGGSLGDTRGVSEYLRAFSRQTTDGLWLTGLSIAAAGNDIVIQGRTLDADLVPAYLQKLRRETALRGHAFESLAVFQPQPPAGAGSAPPGYLEFRLATEHDAASAPSTAPKPGSKR